MSLQKNVDNINQKQSSFITTGLALFSMFFGAGNLIFPLLMGKAVGKNTGFAILGLSITAVIIPLMGLITMILFKGNIKQFLKRIGKTPSFLLLLLLQLILGPFGVIPRLITLMHASIKPYFGDLSLFTFSTFACLLIFLLSFKRQKLVVLLGKYLTPLLLISLGGLIFFGLTTDSYSISTATSKLDSFFEGLISGYNTMDLIAALLFSSLVVSHFDVNNLLLNEAKRKKALFKKMLFSSLIAAFLLLITYIGLCFVSARHAIALDPNISSEQILGAIAIKILGPIGGFLAVITVITACLTTAITLTSIFADYLHKELCNEKIPISMALIVTLLTTSLFANLGFTGIATILTPILQIVYPGLILLTMINLFCRKKIKNTQIHNL